jgi:hypothetical protein
MYGLIPIIHQLIAAIEFYISNFDFCEFFKRRGVLKTRVLNYRSLLAGLANK